MGPNPAESAPSTPPELDAFGPGFFLSYPRVAPLRGDRSDPDYWVKRFFHELATEIRSLDGALRHGANPETPTARNLASCRIFVPLYGDDYFDDEQCGREWAVFEQRRQLRRARTGDDGDSIVPVLWTRQGREDWPPAAHRIRPHPLLSNDLYQRLGQRPVDDPKLATHLSAGPGRPRHGRGVRPGPADRDRTGSAPLPEQHHADAGIHLPRRLLGQAAARPAAGGRAAAARAGMIRACSCGQDEPTTTLAARGRDHERTATRAGRHFLLVQGRHRPDDGVGRFKEALDSDSESYALHRRVYTEGDPPLLSAANNLAVDYRLLGDCYRAAELDQSTYVQLRAVLGPIHPYTLYSSANLARDLRDAGQYKQSTDLLRGALSDLRQTVGENSPETLRTAKSLAVSLRKGGELSESLALAGDTLERYRSEFQSSNPDRQSCALVYAAALSAMGDHEQARELSTDVLVAYEQQLGARHPYTLCCVNNIATYLRKLENHEEALNTAQRAHSGLTTVLGEDHPYTLIAVGNVANSLADAGEYDLAQKMELRAAHKLAEVLRPNHPDVLAIESNRSISLSLLGATSDARQLRSRTIAELEVALGPKHHNTKAAREADRLDWDLEPQTI